MTCPEAFGFDEAKGKAFVKENAEQVEDEKLKDASDNCPVQAISLE